MFKLCSLFLNSSYKSKLFNTKLQFRNLHFLSQIDDNTFSQFCCNLEKVQTLCQSNNKTYVWPKNLLIELGGDEDKALSNLSDLVKQGKDFNNLLQEYEQLCFMEENESDEEIIQMAVDDKKKTKDALCGIKEALVENLLRDKYKDQCNGVLIEVVPGVGGLEAALFADDLYIMYTNYLLSQGFHLDIITSEYKDGGLQKACLVCTPGHIFELLRHESGTHRVQRVPQTESRGRIHTSTASVSVIAQNDEDIEALRPQDIKKYFSRSGGSGGQHANVTNSQAHVVHTPTGISVRCSKTRVAGENLELAMKELTYKVNKLKQDACEEKLNSVRYKHLTQKCRSDKIRTYNYHQDRITDHRFHLQTKSLHSFLQGSSPFHEFLLKVNESFVESEKCEVLQALIEETNLKCLSTISASK